MSQRITDAALLALLRRVPSSLNSSTLPHSTSAVAAVLHALNLASGLRLVGDTSSSASGSSSSMPVWNEDAYTLTYGKSGNESAFRLRVGRMGGRIQVDAMNEVSQGR